MAKSRYEAYGCKLGRLYRLILAVAIVYFMVALGVEALISGVFWQLVRADAFCQ